MTRFYAIPCKASKGQFDNELTVVGVDHRGKEFSCFVSQDLVELESNLTESEVNAKLRVHPLDRKSGLALVKLPCQTFENGSTITILERDLREEAAFKPA